MSGQTESNNRRLWYVLGLAALFVGAGYFPVRYFLPVQSWLDQAFFFTLPPGSLDRLGNLEEFRDKQQQKILDLAGDENSTLAENLRFTPAEKAIGFHLILATYQAQDLEDHFNHLVGKYYQYRLQTQEHLLPRPTDAALAPASDKVEEEDYRSLLLRTLQQHQGSLRNAQAKMDELRQRKNRLGIEIMALERRMAGRDPADLEAYIANDLRQAREKDSQFERLQSNAADVDTRLAEIDIELGGTTDRSRWQLLTDERRMLTDRLAFLNEQIALRSAQIAADIKSLLEPTYRENLEQQRRQLDLRLAAIVKQMTEVAENKNRLQYNVDSTQKLLAEFDVQVSDHPATATNTDQAIVPILQSPPKMQITEHISPLQWFAFTMLAVAGGLIGWVVGRPVPRIVTLLHLNEESLGGVPEPKIEQLKPISQSPFKEKAAMPERPRRSEPAPEPEPIPTPKPTPMPATANIAPPDIPQPVMTQFFTDDDAPEQDVSVVDDSQEQEARAIYDDDAWTDQSQTANQGIVLELFDDSESRHAETVTTEATQTPEAEQPITDTEECSPEARAAIDESAAPEPLEDETDTEPAQASSDQGFNTDAEPGQVDQCLAYARLVEQLRERHACPKVLITALKATEASPRFAADLAIVLQKRRLRVLLVEADEDSTVLAEKVFQCPAVPGFLQWRRGDVWASKVTHNTHLQGVSFMPAGSADDSQAEADPDLTREAHRWANLEPGYDVILLYSPSALTLKAKHPHQIAAGHLRRLADGMFVLTDSRNTAKIEKALNKQHSDIETQLLGIVSVK